MDEKELKVGDMTTREIAEWFGISYDYFRKVAKNKYQELQEYCKYQKVRGKIIISEIYCSIYVKESKLYDQVEEYTKTHWSLQEPESARRVAARFLQDNPEVAKKQGTIEQYARKARKKFWGTPRDLTPGELGGCHYVFVKMYKGFTVAENTYQLMSDEEYESFALVQAKYFKPEAEKIAIALSLMHEGQWTSDMALDFLFKAAEKRDKNYCDFVSEASYVLGCDWMVNATYAENGVYYIEEEDETGVSHYVRVQMETPGAF